jgi:hypothetical protein
MSSLPNDIPQYSPSPTSGGSTNQMALISLGAGIVTWVIGWLGGCGLSFILGPFGACPGLIGLISTIVGIVTGHMGLSQIKASGGREGGNGLAMLGLGLNYISLALSLLAICGVILLFAGGLAFLGLNANEFEQYLTPISP